MTSIDASERLQGLRVLIVEDETLVALLVEDILSDFGCEIVGCVPRLPQAMELVERRALDAAILDVNVAGQEVYPLARILADRGVPFLFVTGYGEGGIADPWLGRPILQKPFQNNDLVEILIQTVNGLKN